VVVLTLLYNRLRKENTVCFLTVTKAALDIPMYELERRQLHVFRES